MAKLETTTDKRNEQKVAEFAGDYLDTSLKRTPDYHPADFVAKDNSIFVEIRCRNCRKHKFPNIVVTAEKWIKLLRLKFGKGEPKVYFVVAWLDRIGIVEVDFRQIYIVPFMRTLSAGKSRSDLDVVVSIPVDDFTDLSAGIDLRPSQNWINVPD